MSQPSLSSLFTSVLSLLMLFSYIASRFFFFPHVAKKHGLSQFQNLILPLRASSPVALKGKTPDTVCDWPSPSHMPSLCSRKGWPVVIGRVPWLAGCHNWQPPSELLGWGERGTGPLKEGRASMDRWVPGICIEVPSKSSLLLILLLCLFFSFLNTSFLWAISN